MPGSPSRRRGGPGARRLPREAGLESLPVGLALDDQIVGVTRKPIDCALCTHRICEHSEPFVWSAIGSEDHGTGAVT